MTRGLDRVVHEPARLRILMLLSAVDETDFKFLQSTLGLTNGNLSSHMNRLDQAGYVRILKGFVGKVTQTRVPSDRGRQTGSLWLLEPD